MRYGFSNPVLNSFVSYLSDRFQRICIDVSMSESRTVVQSFPQGSVLGPLLFSLYTSPVSDIIISHNLSFRICADDIAIFTALTSVSISMP